MPAFLPYAVAITQAANVAIRQVFGTRAMELVATGGTAHETAEALVAAGVPVQFACDAITQRVLGMDPRRSKVPMHLSYFRDAVRESWQLAQAQGSTTPLPPGGRMTPGEETYRNAMRALEDLSTGTDT